MRTSEGRKKERMEMEEIHPTSCVYSGDYATEEDGLYACNNARSSNDVKGGLINIRLTHAEPS